MPHRILARPFRSAATKAKITTAQRKRCVHGGQMVRLALDPWTARGWLRPPFPHKEHAREENAWALLCTRQAARLHRILLVCRSNAWQIKVIGQLCTSTDIKHSGLKRWHADVETHTSILDIPNPDWTQGPGVPGTHLTAQKQMHLHHISSHRFQILMELKMGSLLFILETEKVPGAWKRSRSPINGVETWLNLHNLAISRVIKSGWRRVYTIPSVWMLTTAFCCILTEHQSYAILTAFHKHLQSIHVESCWTVETLGVDSKHCQNMPKCKVDVAPPCATMDPWSHHPAFACIHTSCAGRNL